MNYYNHAHYPKTLEILSTLPLTKSIRYGILYSALLSQQFSIASEQLKALVELLDKDSSDHKLLLTDRAHVLHASLFYFFSSPQALHGLADLFFKPAYMNTLQMLCPHLLQYVTVAVMIVSKKNIKDLNKILCLESTRDPILSLFEALFYTLDLAAASQLLPLVQEWMEKDYFLKNFAKEFMDASRQVLLETCLKIHHSLTFDALTDILNFKNSTQFHAWIQSYQSFKNTLDVSVNDDQKKMELKFRKRFEWDADVMLDKMHSLTQRSIALEQRLDDSVAAASS
jgi:translation initiation factor 3 subunit E